MAVHFLGPSTRTEFLAANRRVYRFTTLDTFFQTVGKGRFSFVSPTLWKDPYEKYFIEREYSMGGRTMAMPIKDKVFASCFSGTSSSEAFWSVYAPNADGVRLTIDMEVLLSGFLEKIKGAEVFIGPVTYFATADLPKLGIDFPQLVSSMKSGKDLLQQVGLMYRKRKAFAYENEVRVMVVPHKVKAGTRAVELPFDLRGLVSEVTFDPRMGDSLFRFLKKHMMAEYGLRPAKAALYRELKLGPIALDRNY
jgi:hypothetical protein